MFPDITVSTINTTLHFGSNNVHGILHPSSEKDRFLYKITTPLEYATNTNNVLSTSVTFARDAKNGIVKELTLKLEVDLTFTKRVSVLHVDLDLSYLRARFRRERSSSIAIELTFNRPNQ